MWVTVAVSSSASPSSAARTVTSWNELQLLLSKLRLAVTAVTSVLSVGSLIVTVTVPVGSVFSFTW